MHYPSHAHLIFKLLHVSHAGLLFPSLLFVFFSFCLQNIAREKEEERGVKTGLKTQSSTQEPLPTVEKICITSIPKRIDKTRCPMRVDGADSAKSRL